MTNQNPQLFANPTDEAFAIVLTNALASAHETIVKESEVFTSKVIATFLANGRDITPFLDEIKAHSIPDRFCDNIDGIFSVYDSFKKKVDNDEATRYDYDLLILDLYHLFTDATYAMRETIDIVSQNFAFEVDGTISQDERDAITKNIALVQQNIDFLVQKYGALD